MNNEQTLRKFEEVITIWENELDNYTMQELLKKPSDEKWSMGQLYNHLISATLSFHLKQIEACIASDENKNKKKNFKGFITYHILGKMPPIKIKVPPSDAYTPKQPESKDAIAEGLKKCRERTKNALATIQNATASGKTAHPGLAFLNAEEWYKLIEMHFRHHLRQKKELDMFLQK